jgi:hypothetical protein
MWSWDQIPVKSTFLLFNAARILLLYINLELIYQICLTLKKLIFFVIL